MKLDLIKMIGSGIIGGAIALSGNYLFNPPSSKTDRGLRIAATNDYVSTNKVDSKEIPFIYDKNILPELSYKGNLSVAFKDNFAPGMKGYIFNSKTGKETELKLHDSYVNEASFILPEEVRKNDSLFEVYVIDRDGNKSKREKFFSLSGVVIAKR